MFESKWFRRVFAWLLLVTVLAVCVSPYVDLDDCTLSPRQLASFLCSVLAAALFLLVARMNFALHAAAMQLAAVGRNTTWLPPDKDALPALQVLRI